MTYTVVPNPDVKATFLKMGKKDSARFEQLVKKLRELGENLESGKPLHPRSGASGEFTSDILSCFT